MFLIHTFLVDTYVKIIMNYEKKICNLFKFVNKQTTHTRML